MEMLVKTINTEDTLARACALSAMGTLGAEKKLEFLKKKYAEYADIDRFMALKAIGDIGTPEAIAFLRESKADPQNEYEYAIKYCVDLYSD
jgi:HEAT repeat protein